MSKLYNTEGTVLDLYKNDFYKDYLDILIRLAELEKLEKGQNKEYDPCENCPNNKRGQLNVCGCTLPYKNQVTY